MDRISLLAMAPSGETYLARDAFGRVWLMQPRGAGEPEIVDPSLVDKAVAYGGFDRVDEAFDSWADLDRFRQGRVAMIIPEVAVDTDRLDCDDVDEMLTIALRWVDDGEPQRARRAALALLRLRVVREDDHLNERVVALLEELDQPPEVFPTEAKTEEQRAFRDRWNQRPAA